MEVLASSVLGLLVQNLIITLISAGAQITLAGWTAALGPSFKPKGFHDSFHTVMISTHLLHLLAEARHRLSSLLLAACLNISVQPLIGCLKRVGGASTPSFPCGRTCKCKDSFSAYYLSDSGFWCLPLSACLCWREKRDKEREGKGGRGKQHLFSPL